MPTDFSTPRWHLISLIVQSVSATFQFDTFMPVFMELLVSSASFTAVLHHSITVFEKKAIYKVQRYPTNISIYSHPLHMLTLPATIDRSQEAVGGKN